MRKRLPYLLLAMVLVACPPPPAASDQGGFPLQVTVLDVIDGLPLSGVMVVETHHHCRGVSDRQGICRLGLPHGNDMVELSLAAPGYWPAEVTRPAALPEQEAIGTVVYLQPKAQDWREDIGRSRRELRSEDPYVQAVIIKAPKESLPYPVRCQVSRLASACAWNTPFPEMVPRGTPVGGFRLEMDPITAPFREPWSVTLPVMDEHAGALAAALPLELWSYDRERLRWQREQTALGFHWGGGGQGFLDAAIRHPGLFVFFATDAPLNEEDGGHMVRLSLEEMVAGERRLLPSPLPRRITQEVYLDDGIMALPAVRTALQLRGYVFSGWEESAPVYRIEIPTASATRGGQTNFFECGQYLVIDELLALTPPNERAFLRRRQTDLFLLQGISPAREEDATLEVH